MESLFRAFALILLLSLISLKGFSKIPPTFEKKEGKHERMIDSIEYYLELFTSEHAPDHQEAIHWFLENINTTHEALRTILLNHEKENSRICQGAIAVLGSFKNESDLTILENILKEGKPEFVWQVAQVIAGYNSEESVTILSESANNSKMEIVQAAIVALGRSKNESARKILETLLVNPNELIRYKAAYALGLIGAEESESELMELYNRETQKKTKQLILDILNKNW